MLLRFAVDALGNDISQVDLIQEIAARLNAALNHIDRNRLIAAPDCGLAMLGRDLAMKKLTAMCEAARSV